MEQLRDLFFSDICCSFDWFIIPFAVDTRRNIQVIVTE